MMVIGHKLHIIYFISQTLPSMARAPPPTSYPQLRQGFGIRPCPQKFKQIYVTAIVTRWGAE